MLRLRLLLLLALLVVVAPTRAQVAPCEEPAIPLEELLDDDGTIRNDHGYRGSVEARGWRITTDSAGRPRFVRSDSMSLSMSAVPDDEHWSQFSLPGVNGPVDAIATRNGTVYMGGSFTKAGGGDAGYVASWNSTTYTWSNVGGGVSGPVFAVAVDGRDLFVGGMFTHAGTMQVNNVARYDLAAGTWHAMGATPGVELVGGIGQVRSIVISGDTVFVGGRFSKAGDRNAASVAAWLRSSNTWLPLGSGITGGEALVYSMVLFRDELYIGGNYTFSGGVRARSISIWNRAMGAWTPLDTGVIGIVRAMAAQGDELYVGGEFTRFGNSFVTHIVKLNMVTKRLTRIGNPAFPGQNYGLYNPVYSIAVGPRGVYVGGVFDRTGTNVPVRRVALWTGTTWKALGSGVAGRYVSALAVEGERVYAGGDFTGAGDRIVNYVGMYGGGNWQGLANAPDNGVNGNVYAAVTDGTDLYVGGDFTAAGGVRTHYVARWNGLEWAALASGTSADLDGPVRALAIGGGALYAGGEFTTAGGSPARHVARWDFASARWTPLAAGTNGPVRALALSGSTLYAGGAFDTAGGVRARNIAGWSSGAWSPLGDGAFAGVNDTVQAIVADGDEVFAGGYFTRAGGIDVRYVARYAAAGRIWSALDSGVSGRSAYEPSVHALMLDGERLYVGGEFSRAGDSVANYVAYWNRDEQEWHPIDVGSGRGVCNTVYAIGGDRDGLYVGGRFVVAGDIGARRVAFFDGEWSALGTGINNGTDNDVYAIARYGGQTYVGGRMSLAGGMRANQIARWDGSMWHKLSGDPQLGVDGVVRALAINGDDIYVGGNFLAAGDAASSRIARWNKRSGVWTLLGTGVDGAVFALAATETDVYVGGRFTKAGNVAVGNIARWHVATGNWFPIGPAGDNGLDGPVFALAVDDDYLYAGGGFDAAGDIEARNIARWNLAELAWEPIGDGTNEPVLALAVAADGIYVGGAFTRAGGLDINYVARLTRDDQWIRLGGGPDAAVNAIAVVGGRVYVGGDFRTAGIARAAHIGYWDLAGSEWYELGTGVSGTNLTSVYAIAANNRSVYVGGSFTHAGGIEASFVAHWNVRDAKWEPLGSGVGNAELPTVYALALDELGLYVGGNFTRAGDKLSLHFGRWNKLLTGLNPSAVTGESDAGATLALAPQPVDAAAEIRLTLARPSHATLSIVGADGRHVATLLDHDLPAGERLVRLDARGLAAGTYMCVLRIGERVVTNTFVVLR